MREIPLTQGKVALVDDADFEWLSQWKWCASRNYAVRRLPRSEGGYMVRLHRVLLNAPEGMEVDHIDGNPLNNTRANLRLATHSQNSKNLKTPVNNTSGCKGVSWHKRGQKWTAEIWVNEAKVYLGLFADKAEAIAARLEAEDRYFGEFKRVS